MLPVGLVNAVRIDGSTVPAVTRAMASANVVGGVVGADVGVAGVAGVVGGVVGVVVVTGLTLGVDVTVIVVVRGGEGGCASHPPSNAANSEPSRTAVATWANRAVQVTRSGLIGRGWGVVTTDRVPQRRVESAAGGSVTVA